MNYNSILLLPTTHPPTCSFLGSNIILCLKVLSEADRTLVPRAVQMKATTHRDERTPAGYHTHQTVLWTCRVSEMISVSTLFLRCVMRKATIRPVWSIFAVRMNKAWVFSYPLSAQRRLWSDWAGAQADLSLRWAHRSFCWFCHAAAHLWN